MISLLLVDTALLVVMFGTAVATSDHEEGSLKASQQDENGRAERWERSVMG